MGSPSPQRPVARPLKGIAYWIIQARQAAHSINITVHLLLFGLPAIVVYPGIQFLAIPSESTISATARMLPIDRALFAARETDLYANGESNLVGRNKCMYRSMALSSLLSLNRCFIENSYRLFDMKYTIWLGGGGCGVCDKLQQLGQPISCINRKEVVAL